MKTIGATAIIALTGGLYAQNKIVSTEVSFSFDSSYMTYGVIDGKDPIFTPGATATFFDWAYIGVESIFNGVVLNIPSITFYGECPQLKISSKVSVWMDYADAP
jgi:hypothetical protein